MAKKNILFFVFNCPVRDKVHYVTSKLNFQWILKKLVLKSLEKYVILREKLKIYFWGHLGSKNWPKV